MVNACTCCAQIEQQLLQADVESADLEARELTAYVAGLDARRTADWRAQMLTAEQEAHVQALLARRLAGEPVAYLIGEWDFYGNTFAVTPDVLIPRADTEWLCDAAVHHAKNYTAPHILDLCCGSGCIGISLALAVLDARVTAADCSAAALAVTIRNADRYGLRPPRFEAMQADALQSGSIAGVFDLVVSNPPYITAEEMAQLDPSVDAYEPHLALFGGEDGLDFYRAMARQQAFCLAPGGQILVECGWKQGQQVAALFAASGWKNVEVRRDLAGIQRIVCAMSPD